MNQLNDALVRVYSNNASAAKLLFFEALVPSDKPRHQQVYDALQVLYPGRSYNDAMSLYLNDATPVWGGVLVCSEVLVCSKVVQCE